ncbi:hypothetical protein BC629DRAFT_1594331 [Irpex lacteus]|nr:hypothetical protein BC629DRAFT_1594331 [Irpex lacteus]
MAAFAATRVALSRMPRATRPVHSNINWAHPEHLPFGTTNRAGFATKYWAFLAAGFSLPFVAGWWQLRKSAGAA